MLRGRGGRRRGPRRHARRGLPHPPRLRAGDPCRRRARLRRRGPGGLRRGCRVAPPGPPPAAGPADRPRPGGHPESPRRRHRASGRADARRARTRRPGPCLGRAVRRRRGDRDAPRDRRLGPPPGPGARTRATRGGGGLHADDRLGRPPDRGAGRDPLGRGAGPPRMGGAGRRGEHVVAGCPPRVGGREAGPHPMSWNRLRVPRLPRLTRFPSPRRFLSLRVLRVLLGRPRPPLATGRPGLPIAPPTRGGRARDQRAGGRPSGPGVVGRALPRDVSGPEVAGSAGSRAPAAATAGAWKELVTLTVVLVGLSRLAEGPALWATAVLAFAAHVLASLEVLGAEAAADDDGVPVEALLVPGVAAVAAIGALRLVPVGLLLVPGLFAAGCLVLAAVALERRMLGRAKGATADDRAALLSLALLVAFVAFAGSAASIPGALVEPGGGAAGARPGLPLEGMALLAVADGLLAGLLGYRLAALRAPNLRGAALAALSYSVVVAVAAAGLRAMAIPRLLGPALLTLVLYLWSAYRGGPRTGRADARWVWELLLLLGLGAIVIAWNLLAQV